MFSFRVDITLFLFSLFSYSHCYDESYCSLDLCDGNKSHVLCKYQSSLPNARCLGYKGILDDSSKMLVLEKMNERRNRIASGEVKSLPSAQNMEKLEWNDELAKFAQRWADQCSDIQVQDECRNFGNMSVGQCIATVYGESPGLTAVSLVDVWYTELLDIDADVIRKYIPSVEKKSKHYDYFTQLLWAESKEVGCGGVKYNEIRGHSNHTVYRLVCNFAPSGNRKGEPVYECGVPCTRCPGGRTSDSLFKGLCSDTAIKKKTISNVMKINGKDNEWLSRPKEELSVQSKTEDKNINDIGLLSVTENDDYVPFTFFTLLDGFKPVEKITTSQSAHTNKNISCDNKRVVEELMELLKQRISNEFFFKDIFPTNNNEQTENFLNFSDPGVFKFMKEIHKKKQSTTLTRPTEDNTINSTLLAELVNAVIFKNADKFTTHSLPEEISQFITSVNPIRIQAALAHTQKRNDFAGHYFFPEDESVDDLDTDSGSDSDRELGETLYNSEIPVSDVIKELESYKRTSYTKGFLDEILESDLMDEEPSSTTHKLETKNPYGHLSNYMTQNPIESSASTEDASDDLGQLFSLQKRKRRRHAKSRAKIYDNSQECSQSLQYKELLKKITSDIKRLRLYERFHCSPAISIYSSLCIIIVSTIIAL